MLSTLCAIIVILSFLVFKYKWQRRRLEKMMNQFDGPPTVPLVGNALETLCSSKELLQKGMKYIQDYKSPFRVWLGNKPCIVVFDPQDFQIIANKTLEKDSSYKFIADMLGDGVFTAEVQKWKKHRQILNSAFNPTILLNYFLSVFNRHNDNLIRRLKNEANTDKQFDLWPYFILTSVNTISETALGLEKTIPDSVTLQFGQAVIKSAAIVSKRIYSLWLQPSIVFGIYKYLKGYGSILKIVQEYPLMMLKAKQLELQNRTAELNEKENFTRNFMSILLEFHQKGVFNDQEIKDEVISIMFGGSETTAVTNCFVLLMLAMRPEIQDKVYKEIYEIFGDSDRPPTPDDLSNLHFLEQCIKETLRRFPIVPLIIRHASEDIHINGKYTIPAGADIILAILGVHFSPEIYPNPLAWDPDHFNPEREAQRPKCSFVSFSLGPRGCLGEKYARIAMKAQLSTVLRHYKFSTDFQMNDIDLDFDFIIRSSKGYNVKIEYRRNKY